MNKPDRTPSKTTEKDYAAARSRNNLIIAEALNIVSPSEKTPEVEALLGILNGDRSGFRIVNAEFVYRYGDVVRIAYGIMKNRLKPWLYLNKEKTIVRKRDYSAFVKVWLFKQIEERLIELGILNMQYRFVNKKGNKQIIIMLIRLLVDYGFCKKDSTYASLMRHFMQEYNVPKLKRLNRTDSSLQAKVLDDFPFFKKLRTGHFAA